MNIKDIKDLLVTLDKTSIRNIEIEDNAFKIKISKDSATAVQTTVEQPVGIRETKPEVTVESVEVEEVIEEEDLYIVKSPIVGAFYSSPSPDAGAFVSVGDKVTENQALCIIEAMKIMNEIQSDVSGEVVEILVENEDIVEYGQPLMKIRR